MSHATHSHDYPACCQPDNGDSLGVNATLKEPISLDGTPVLGETYTVPARCGRAVRLKAGEVIKIVNTHGTQVCDTWLFNSEDLSEFLSMEHARAHCNSIIPKAGDELFSNRRRSIGTLLTDTSPGIHDTLMAACDLHRYTNLGVVGYHDSCADNMRLALAAIGLRSHEVPQPFNLWMNIPVKPGDYVEIRAEMDVVVVMSACPQDIVPINDLNPVEVTFSVHA